jgi:protein-S-isoprenylcysteine O-methyltransferase Ste14
MAFTDFSFLNLQNKNVYPFYYLNQNGWEMGMRRRFAIYAKTFITFCGVYILIIYLPNLLIKVYSSIDPLNTDEMISRLTSWRLASLFGLFGSVLYLWTVFIQLKKGRGTPIPMLPPEKLLVAAPYSFCRNPMVLGAITYYFSICTFISFWGAFYIVAPVAVLVLVYIKFWEEGELESRFGQAYIEYKRHTAFLIPRIWGKRLYFLFLR